MRLNTIRRPLGLLLFLGLLVTAAGASDAASPAACRTIASSYASDILAPNSGGDEGFFSKPSVLPSIMFLIGNNTTMQNFPIPIPNGDGSAGCTDPTINSLFNLTLGGATFDTNYKHEYIAGSYYVTYSDREPWDKNGAPEGGKGWKNNFDDISQWNVQGVCGDANGNGSQLAQLAGTPSLGPQAGANSCTSCMASKGWYRGPAVGGGHGYVYAVDGRFLNVFPPKFAIARKVALDVVNSQPNARIGIATLTTNDDYYDPASLD